jgi:hypothetical protein
VFARGALARYTRGSVAERVARFGPAARARLTPYFEAAGVDYPPAHFYLLGFKAERELQLYVPAEGGPRHVRTYPWTAASGELGPKLREGDRQVPEGLYGIESLNPNSRFHLSLRLDYPNAADRARAVADGRSNLGGDIMIHGGAASVGCIAVGDEAIEELFVLAADARLKQVQVLISPVDLRLAHDVALPREPAWVEGLYADMRQILSTFPSGDPRQ